MRQTKQTWPTAWASVYHRTTELQVNAQRARDSIPPTRRLHHIEAGRAAALDDVLLLLALRKPKR